MLYERFDVSLNGTEREEGRLLLSARDVFGRKKWLSSPPQSDHEAWRSREEEILEMNQYLQELVSWSNKRSVDFGREIAQAARWQTQITWRSLTKSQQSRAVRLFVEGSIQWTWKNFPSDSKFQ